MTATSRLGRQIAEIISALSRENIRFALIGGLALASHKVIRATQDVDLLIGAAAFESRALVGDHQLLLSGPKYAQPSLPSGILI